MPVKRVVFLKAHVNDYTKKDGTVVHAHDDNRPMRNPVRNPTNIPLAAHSFAKGAAAYAGRSKDPVFGDEGRKTSEVAVDESARAKSPRDHMYAARTHRSCAQHHRTAAHFIKQRGGSEEDIMAHKQAMETHEMAAAVHEQGASAKKKGVEPPHHRHARSADYTAAQIPGDSGKAGTEASKHALALTEAASTPEGHTAAAAAHEAAQKVHEKGAESHKYSGPGGWPAPEAQPHRIAANLHQWAAAGHREEAGKGSSAPKAKAVKAASGVKPPSFHVSREEDGDEYIDSTHTHFAAAKARMMQIHHDDSVHSTTSSPTVHSMPHGILAFPHVDTGKPTLTPAYKRAKAAAPAEHKEHWADD